MTHDAGQSRCSLTKLIIILTPIQQVVKNSKWPTDLSPTFVLVVNIVLRLIHYNSRSIHNSHKKCLLFMAKYMDKTFNFRWAWHFSCISSTPTEYQNKTKRHSEMFHLWSRWETFKWAADTMAYLLISVWLWHYQEIWLGIDKTH